MVTLRAGPQSFADDMGAALARLSESGAKSGSVDILILGPRVPVVMSAVVPRHETSLVS